jgi:hypothetical protein
MSNMNRELRAKMLGSVEGLERREGGFAVAEGRRLELLQRGASGGAAPLPRVREVHLEEGWAAVITEDGTWLLPYEVITGVKISDRGSAAGPRTGFLR